MSKNTISPIIASIHFGEEQGLTSKTVYAILQDSEGFIWFGTEAGVFRYDGKIFKHFTINDGISDNEVLDLFEDRSKRIWFMTFNGYLSFWKNGRIYNPGNTPFLKKAYNGTSVLSCYEDSEGSLWFGTKPPGLIVLSNESAREIRRLPNGERMESEFVHEDHQGEFWSFNGNRMINLQNNFPFSIALPAPVSSLNACHAKRNIDLYYYSETGVFRISDHKTVLEINKSELPGAIGKDNIMNIVVDDDLLWLCTTNGCFEYRNGKLSSEYFKKLAITSMLKDREGNLWFSTLNEGVFMMPANHKMMTNFNSSSGLSGEKIHSLTTGPNGSLWLGYNNGTVDEIKGTQKKTYKLRGPGKPPYMRVTCLLADSSITWCGTDDRIYFIEDGKIDFLLLDENTKPYAVKRLLMNHAHVVFATYSHGFFEVQRDRKGYHCEHEIDTISRAFSMLETEPDHYLVSEINGLMEYFPCKSYDHYKTNIDLSSVRINDMKYTQDSLLILATAGKGLYILKDGRLLRQINTVSGLSDDNCNRIFVLPGVIYVASNTGINVLEKKEGNYIVSQVITTREGMLSNMVSDVIADDTAIYAATDNGLTVIRKSDNIQEAYVGKVYIMDIITDSVQLPAKQYSFKNDIPRLLVRFAYPVFNPANRVKIKYRLLQDEKDNTTWIYSGGNEVEFSSLNPGNYILQLKPAIETAGDKNITSLLFRIKPLWWKTLASKILFSLAILCIVIAVARRRTQLRYEKKMAELKQLTILETERNRIASDMHDDLGADLTHIAIMGEIIKRDKTLETDTVNKLNKMTEASKEVIDKMSEIIWALNSSNDSLSNLISYIHRYSKQFLQSKDISCTVDFPNEIPDRKLSAAYRRNVFLIFKEAINNMVKHSGTKKADLVILVEGKKLVISIEDYGSGMLKDELSGNTYGIRSMKKRAKDNGAELEIISRDHGGTMIRYDSTI